MSKQTLRRPFHSTIRAIDSAAGTAQYVSSSQAIDSYNEVVSMKGWDGSRLEKNAPVVDSHNYSSIDCLLGKITRSAIVRDQLIQDVQFAVDVPENILAQKAFAMIDAGYLKGCSIGFIPSEIVTRHDAGDLMDETLEDLGLGDLENSILCIYTKWQQLELSICCIGANPDAIVIQNSYKAGILNDEDLERWPTARFALESIGGRRARSFFPPSSQSEKTSTQPPMSQIKFLDKFAGLTGKTVDHLESARRGQSESDLYRATGQARLEMAQYRRLRADEFIRAVLAHDEKRRYLNTLPRAIARVSLTGGSKEYIAAHFVPYEAVMKSLLPSPADALGSSLLPIDVSTDIFDLALIYGAYKDLGVTPMSSMFTRFAQTKTTPTAVWITPQNFNTTIPADTALTGAQLTPEANSLGIILPVSRELLSDEKANLSIFLLTKLAQGIAAAIDYAAFSGNGANDTTNGSQTGIFVDNTIATVNAAQGNATIAGLQRSDFISATNAVTPAALQRGCRWYVNPAFLGQLMLLTDGQGHSYLLKTPGESQDGEWYLCGHPVTWAAQAPGASTPGSKIAAIGLPESYMIALRDALEIMLGSSTGFSSNEQSFRTIARGFCQTRDASGFATLSLAQA